MTDTPSTRPQMGDEEWEATALSANALALLNGTLFSRGHVYQAVHEADDERVRLVGFTIPEAAMPVSAALDALREIKEAAMSCARACLPQPPAQSTVHDEGHPHLIGGEFQSDKYPTTPRGKVPLSVKDPTAQDLLWTYAQRRRVVDGEFANDLELALTKNGFVPSTPAQSGLVEARRQPTLVDEPWVLAEEKAKQSAAITTSKPAPVVTDAVVNPNLLAALQSAIKIANEAAEEWDKAPNGMKAGKILLALAGLRRGYRADIDAIHLTLLDAASPQPDRESEHLPCTCGHAYDDHNAPRTAWCISCDCKAYRHSTRPQATEGETRG